MKKTLTNDVHGSVGDLIQDLIRDLTDPFTELFYAQERGESGSEEKHQGLKSTDPDEEAAVLWYALEVEKAERAYDEHMEELCKAAFQAKGPDDLRKAMEGHTDKYTFLGSRLHRAIYREHNPWISVQDLKPEDVDLDWVQVQPMLLPECCWGVPETAEMRDGKWYTMDDVPLEENETIIITHWRPLPEPPEEDIA